MKENPITIGFDDARFDLKSISNTTQLIGVVCQGVRMVNVMSEKITIDGDDANEALIKMVKLNRKHVQYILTDTITFAGFNLINLKTIFRQTGKPIIAVTEKNVNLESVKKALINKFPDNYKSKLQNILESGNLYKTKIETAGGLSDIYFHVKGINIEKAELLLRKLCLDSKLPEPIRLAHIIGRM